MSVEGSIETTIFNPLQKPLFPVTRDPSVVNYIYVYVFFIVLPSNEEEFFIFVGPDC